MNIIKKEQKKLILKHTKIKIETRKNIILIKFERILFNLINNDVNI